MLDFMNTSIKRYIEERKEQKFFLEHYANIINVYETFLTNHPDPPSVPEGKEILVEDLERIMRQDELPELMDLMAGTLEEDASSRVLIKHIETADVLVDMLMEFWKNPESYSARQATSLQLSEEETLLFLLLLLKPFYFRIRKKDSYPDWEKRYCPICGSLPHYSRFEKEAGKRFLACPVCEAQWPFPRFTCAFCGKIPKEQTYFTTEEYPYYRVYLCEFCRSYIKTAVEKELEHPVYPFIEDLITPDLDEAAQKEGYHTNPGYFRYAGGRNSSE